MLSSIFDSHLNDDPISFQPPPWISIVAVIALTTTLLLAVFIYLGIWLAMLTSLSFVLAFVLWLKIGYRVPISRRALPGHILLIIALLIHGAEQLHGDYATIVTTAFPNLVQPSNIITNASMALSLSLIATVFWLFGGALAFYHARTGGFIMLLLAVWSCVFPISHLLITVLSKSAPLWIPGMASGAVIVVLAFTYLRALTCGSLRVRCYEH